MGDSRLKSLFEEVVAPILMPENLDHLPPDLPRRALETLDRIGDLEARGDEILALLGPGEATRTVGRFLSGKDSVTKRGRTLSFELASKRTLAAPSGVVRLEAERSFSLEFRSGAEGFGDPNVRKRFEAARENLPDLAPEDVLAAAVLPQEKALIGVNTPLRFGLMGISIPLCLRFTILAAGQGRLRLFAAGPIVKEISF